MLIILWCTLCARNIASHVIDALTPIGWDEVTPAELPKWIPWFYTYTCVFIHTYCRKCQTCLNRFNLIWNVETLSNDWNKEFCNIVKLISCCSMRLYCMIECMGMTKRQRKSDCAHVYMTVCMNVNKKEIRNVKCV